MTLLVGQVLHGFCGGFFGRDSYEDKRIEAVGADWVVVRTNAGCEFASGETIHDDLAEYTRPPEEPEDDPEFRASLYGPTCRCGHRQESHLDDGEGVCARPRCKCTAFVDRKKVEAEVFDSPLATSKDR